MKILYDHQIFELQRFGGISRYFSELLRHFGQYPSPEWELSTRYSRNEYLTGIKQIQNSIESPGGSYNDFCWGREFTGKWMLYYLKNKFLPGRNISEINRQLSIASLEKGDYDLFHPTYFSDYFLKHLRGKPYVLTVYDMIYEIFPEHFKLDERTPERKKKLLKNASKIISISESTKKDIVDIYGIDRNKISVIYLGNSLSRIGEKEIDIQCKLPESYLLYVGKRGGDKNFYFLVQSIRRLLKRDSEIHLVCTGNAFTNEEKKYFDRLGVQHKIHHFFATEMELGLLYRKALAFVFPSLYEGFGIPVLEAFSRGCPVLLSDRSSFPEVGGDAALYFDPKSVESICSAVSKILYNEDLRIDLTSKGYSQLKKFSWEKTSCETNNVYTEIVKEAENRQVGRSE